MTAARLTDERHKAIDKLVWYKRHNPDMQAKCRGTSHCAARLAGGPDCQASCSLVNRVCHTLLIKSIADKRTENLSRCPTQLPRTPSKPQTASPAPAKNGHYRLFPQQLETAIMFWDPLHYPLAPSRERDAASQCSSQLMPGRFSQGLRHDRLCLPLHHPAPAGMRQPGCCCVGHSQEPHRG